MVVGGCLGTRLRAGGKNIGYFLSSAAVCGILSHIRSSGPESHMLGTTYLVAPSTSSNFWQQPPKFAIPLAGLRQGLAWLPQHGAVSGSLLGFAAVVGVQDSSLHGDGGTSPCRCWLQHKASKCIFLIRQGCQDRKRQNRAEIFGT